MMETSVPFDALVELLIYLFIGLAMLCIGLASTLDDMVALGADRAWLSRALIANIVVGPFVAIALVALIPMDPAAATVLLLLGFAPGGINAVQFSTKVPKRLVAAGALLVVLSMVSLVTAPIAARLSLPSDAELALPVDELVFRITLLILAPLVIGAAIRARAPDLAEKLYKPAMLVSTLTFIASVILSMGTRQVALGEFGTASTVAFLLFILAMMAAGWFLGGPTTEGRQVLAFSTNLRNVGLVYVLVDGCCDDNLLAAALLGFMALMILPNAVLTVGCAVWRKRHMTP